MPRHAAPAGSDVAGIVVGVGESRVGRDDRVVDDLHDAPDAGTLPRLATNSAMLVTERKWSMPRSSSEICIPKSSSRWSTNWTNWRESRRPSSIRSVSGDGTSRWSFSWSNVMSRSCKRRSVAMLNVVFETLHQLLSVDLSVPILGEDVEGHPASRQHARRQFLGQFFAEGSGRDVGAGRRHVRAAYRGAFESIGVNGDHGGFLQGR